MLENILNWLAREIISLINSLGYGGVFLLMALESANIIIPSEIIMPFSGFLVARGNFSFWGVVFWGAAGNLVGSIFSYKLASGIISLREKSKVVKFLIPQSLLEKSQRWFFRWGEATTFFSRLLPIIRTFISFPAGLGKMKFWRFCLYTFLGSFLWSTLLTYLGLVLGENWPTLRTYFEKFDYLVAALIVGSVVFWLIKHLNGSRNKKSV